MKDKEVPYVLVETLPRYSNYKKEGIQWLDVSLLLWIYVCACMKICLTSYTLVSRHREMKLELIWKCHWLLNFIVSEGALHAGKGENSWIVSYSCRQCLLQPLAD